MGFSPNLQDQERDKFVESPTRPNKTAIETVPTNTALTPLFVQVVGEGSSAMYTSTTISTDYTVATEDFILVVGSSPVIITLPIASTFNKKLIIKNASTEDVTIVPPSGFVNGINELKIRARRNPTYSEANLGNSITLAPTGGQFWLV